MSLNKFIQVNFINFYPSINEKLLKNVITWARQFESISLEDKEIIMESKNSIIFNGLTPSRGGGGTESPPLSALRYCY